MHTDAFGCIRMRSDAFGCIQMHPDASNGHMGPYGPMGPRAQGPLSPKTTYRGTPLNRPVSSRRAEKWSNDLAIFRMDMVRGQNGRDCFSRLSCPCPLLPMLGSIRSVRSIRSIRSVESHRTDAQGENREGASKGKGKGTRNIGSGVFASVGTHIKDCEVLVRFQVGKSVDKSF